MGKVHMVVKKKQFKYAPAFTTNRSSSRGGLLLLPLRGGFFHHCAVGFCHFLCVHHASTPLSNRGAKRRACSGLSFGYHEFGPTPADYILVVLGAVTFGFLPKVHYMTLFSDFSPALLADIISAQCIAWKS
jgi:hypothetical protein